MLDKKRSRQLLLSQLKVGLDIFSESRNDDWLFSSSLILDKDWFKHLSIIDDDFTDQQKVLVTKWFNALTHMVIVANKEGAIQVLTIRQHVSYLEGDVRLIVKHLERNT
jgi:hypothetical protein